MIYSRTLAAVTALALATPLAAQVTNDPFPEPIGDGWAPLVVGYTELARIPGVGGAPPLMTNIVDEPGTQRMFVNDMNGPITSIGYDGHTITRYVDTNDPRWGYSIQTQGSERGLQSFAFHPQFGQEGTPGYGKFYTWVDIVDTAPTPDFRPGPDGRDTHDTVLLEWTARNPRTATYDGGPPREMMRLEQPFPNHNAGQLAFDPTAAPGSPDYGMLYMGVADGGSGGDPMNMSQDLGSAFGKIFRIDPLGSNSANGKYGIPADNPFLGRAGALGEIYAYGARNPQKFAWDPENGNFFMSDIGQNTVEELTLVPRGANLGWNVWEGSFRYVGREGVDTRNPRGDRSVTFPVAEYGQPDPLLLGQSAAVGLAVYRANRVPAISNMVIWGDNPSGEVFAVPADNLPNGGQAPIRRVLFNDGGQARTLLQLVQKHVPDATQPDLRIGSGPEGEVLLLNKQDGIVRMLVPAGGR
ncbi:MAG TPA: PQQ-dependent sugar dehydrogenase [Longimicrobiales bacterium]|nr:PQQ-dependent sugar dehydrogenase [Longimicrobiales bacterium]